MIIRVIMIIDTSARNFKIIESLLLWLLILLLGSLERSEQVYFQQEYYAVHGIRANAASTQNYEMTVINSKS